MHVRLNAAIIIVIIALLQSRCIPPRTSSLKNHFSALNHLVFFITQQSSFVVLGVFMSGTLRFSTSRSGLNSSQVSVGGLCCNYKLVFFTNCRYIWAGLYWLVSEAQWSDHHGQLLYFIKSIKFERWFCPGMVPVNILTCSQFGQFSL